jgi:hypothetical protein
MFDLSTITMPDTRNGRSPDPLLIVSGEVMVSPFRIDRAASMLFW